MTVPTPETKELRRARLWSMRTAKNKPMTLSAIAKIENVSRARIGQLIGKSGHLRPVSQTLIKIYRIIEEFNSRISSPTMAEIGELFLNKKGGPTSTSVISYYIDQMSEAGMIAPRRPRDARQLRVLPLDRRSPKIREMLNQEAESDA